MPDGKTPTRQYPARPCPVCGRLRSTSIYRQQFAADTDFTLLRGYDVVACGDCGCGFADDLPGQAAFDAYYQSMSKYEYADRGGQESPCDRARQEQLADFIAEAVPDRNARVVDVGCSTGALLDALKHRGFARVAGLDPSPACAAQAQALYGVEVRTGSLSDAPVLLGGAEVMILSHVLEHVLDCNEVLAALHRLLPAGGHLIAAVPDVTRFAEFVDAPFREFSTDHINYFSARSLQNALRMAGFAPCLRGSAVHELRARIRFSECRLACRKTQAPTSPHYVRDTDTRPALRDYVRRSCELERGLHAAINRVVDAGKPIVVWGTGAHTLRLLATSRLAQAQIVAFVDSDPHCHGRTLNGVGIITPAELSRRPEPILVSSRVYQAEIVQQIRGQMNLRNEILLLYPTEAA